MFVCNPPPPQQSTTARAKVKSGDANPLSPTSISTHPVFRLLWPCARPASVWARAAVLVLHTLVLWYGVLTRGVLLPAVCSGGWLQAGVSEGSGECVIPVGTYVWARGIWAAVHSLPLSPFAYRLLHTAFVMVWCVFVQALAVSIWPVAACGSLLSTNLPADVMQEYEARVTSSNAAAPPAPAPSASAPTAASAVAAAPSASISTPASAASSASSSAAAPAAALHETAPHGPAPPASAAASASASASAAAPATAVATSSESQPGAEAEAEGASQVMAEGEAAALPTTRQRRAAYAQPPPPSA